MPPAGHAAGLLEPFAYGRGFQEIVRPAQPAAGANFSLLIDGRWDTRLLAIVFRLVTDANAGDRVVSVDYLDQDGLAYDRNGGSVAVVASSTVDFTGQLDRAVSEWNQSLAGTLLPMYFPVNDVFMEPGHTIRITIAGVKAGDQLSAIGLVLERFPTGTGGYPEGTVHPRQRRRR